MGQTWGTPKQKPPVVMPLILGVTASEWLSKQANDYAHSLTMAVRNNDPVQPIDHLPRQLGNKTKAFTTTWARATSQQRQTQTAENSKKVAGFWHVSVLDSRTSDICLVHSNKRWTMDKQPIDHDLEWKSPPLHPHCRSEMTQITDVSKEPATLTVDDWLDSMSDKEQAQVLGVGKAQMYRRGDITLRDLLDQSGRPKPLYRFASDKVNSVASAHFKRTYEFLEREIAKHSDLSTMELRKQLSIGIKWDIAELNKETQQLFGATTNKVWLSDDTLIKQVVNRKGQPIDVDSYQLVDGIIKNADELVIESENNIVFFKQNNDWYKAVVKTTRNKNELYLLSFSRSNENEVSRKTGKKKATR